MVSEILQIIHFNRPFAGSSHGNENVVKCEFALLSTLRDAVVVVKTSNLVISRRRRRLPWKEGKKRDPGVGE